MVKDDGRTLSFYHFPGSATESQRAAFKGICENNSSAGENCDEAREASTTSEDPGGRKQ